MFEAVWDEDAVRDELERFVAEQFGDAEHGIFVLDESAFPQKGPKSVSVKRQDWGDTRAFGGVPGKKEHCQAGVFLTYVSPREHVFLDRRLYLPEDWAADAERRTEAGVPKEVTFQTKPALGRVMLEQAWTLGVRGGWLPHDVPSGWSRWVVARRSIANPTEIAYYLAVAPAETSLQTLVHVAGARWTVEPWLEDAKGEAGLDQ